MNEDRSAPVELQTRRAFFARTLNHIERFRQSDRLVVKYAIGGATAAAAQLITLSALIEFFAMPKPIATTIGYLVAVAVNYTMQYYFTFLTNRSHKSATWRFAAVTAFTTVLNLMVFSFFDQYIHYMVAQMLTIASIFVFNYGLNRFFAFKKVEE